MTSDARAYVMNLPATSPETKQHWTEERPDIAAKWHPTKNNGVLPQNVTRGCMTVFWWTDKCGHEWDSMVPSMLKSSGCPLCRHSRIVPGINDLATTHPQFAKEWHPEKNGTLTPQQVHENSGLKAWWLGECGHEWETEIKTRIKDNAPCPICTNRKVEVGFNDLATKYPALVDEWHSELNGDLTPQDVVYGSPRKVWWHGKCGHDWLSPIDLRVKQYEKDPDKTGCLVCRNRHLLVGFNDFATRYPHLAVELHPEKSIHIDPTSFISSTEVVWWKCCECGYEWEDSISHRATKNGTKCPVCTNQIVVPGINDFATRYPHIAAEFNAEKNPGVDLTQIYSGGDELWWKCRYNHEWQASLYRRSRGQGNCPCCAKNPRRKQTSYNEQALLYYVRQIFPSARNRFRVQGTEVDVAIPEYKIAIEYDGEYWHTNKKIKQDIAKYRKMVQRGWTLIRVREPKCPNLPKYHGSIVWLKTRNPEDVEAAILETLILVSNILSVDCTCDINLKRDSAEIAASMAITQTEQSLACVNPSLAEEWHPTKNGQLTPEMISPHASFRVWWQCAEEHEWQTTPNSRMHGSGCPKCKRFIVNPGVNDIVTLKPELVPSWHPTLNGDITPDQVCASSHQLFWWKCPCGVEFQKTPQQHNGRCAICNKHRVMHGENDLATTHPHLAERWDYEQNTILPTQVTQNSSVVVSWKCIHGHQYQRAVIHEVRAHGCPQCFAENRRQIIATNLEDGTEYTFAGISAAAKTLGCHTSNIGKCLSGAYHSTKGYAFRDANVDA